MEFSSPNNQAWKTLEDLIDPDPELREKGLEDLESLDGFEEHPLMVYILATRLSDPELEIRFHAVQLLGKLVDHELTGDILPEPSFRILTNFTTEMDKSQLIKLLEVSAAYLAAESALTNILKLCSYAGKALGGIVNDRKLPVEIRQQAIYFCGEVGFLNTVDVIRNLIQRIEKNRANPGQSATRKKHLDEESLAPYAVTALAKLEGT